MALTRVSVTTQRWRCTAICVVLFVEDVIGRRQPSTVLLEPIQEVVESEALDSQIREGAPCGSQNTELQIAAVFVIRVI